MQNRQEMLSQPYRTLMGNAESSMPLQAALVNGLGVNFALQP